MLATSIGSTHNNSCRPKPSRPWRRQPNLGTRDSPVEECAPQRRGLLRPTTSPKSWPRFEINASSVGLVAHCLYLRVYSSIVRVLERYRQEPPRAERLPLGAHLRAWAHGHSRWAHARRVGPSLSTGANVVLSVARATFLWMGSNRFLGNHRGPARLNAPQKIER